LLFSIGVWNGTAWSEVGDYSYPFTGKLEVHSLASVNNSIFVAGEFLHSDRYELDSFQGAAYYRSGSWLAFDKGVKCSDCLVECDNCDNNFNITIPIIYTLSVLPSLTIQPTDGTTSSSKSSTFGFTNFLGTGGLFEEYGIPTFFGSEIYSNLTATNTTSVINNFFSWQLWAIIFGAVFFVSLVLACIINACFRLCGCISNIADDSLTESEESA